MRPSLSDWYRFLLWLLLQLAGGIAAFGASTRTANFVIEAPTSELAEKIGKAAETYRHDLAIEWTGSAMPDWSRPCPIVAKVAPNLGAGGATSFVFDKGEVFKWDMQIQGSEARILDSVLPHEVTHTIFASYFRQPLPRWADEGACSTVEDVSERAKLDQNLVTYLRTGRGIAFGKMFAMTEYPQDVLPLYSQGYSLARYLIDQGGRRKFVAFMSDGLKAGDWAGAIQRSYGYSSLQGLQSEWLAWVKSGGTDGFDHAAEQLVPVAAQSKSPRSLPVAAVDRSTPSPAMVDPKLASYRISMMEGRQGNATMWSSGSGTAIGPHCIITNSHVVDHQAGQNVRLADIQGQTFNGRVAAIDDECDFAIIFTDAELAYVPLSESGPRVGENTTLIGFGQHAVLNPRSASIVSNSRFYHPSGRLHYVELSAASEQGDSGGGVFNADGELTAVVWGCDGRQANAVSVEHLVARLPIFERRCGPMGCSIGCSSGGCRSGNCSSCAGSGCSSCPTCPNRVVAPPTVSRPLNTTPSTLGSSPSTFTPGPQPGLAGASCSCDPSLPGRVDSLGKDLSELRDGKLFQFSNRLDALEKQVSELTSQPGPMGPAGPAGPPGSVGKDADITAIAAAVAGQLKNDIAITVKQEVTNAISTNEVKQPVAERPPYPAYFEIRPHKLEAK